MHVAFSRHQLTPISGDTPVTLNQGAICREVGFQGTDLFLFVEADVQNPAEVRHFACYFEGHQFEKPLSQLRYVGWAPSGSSGFAVYEIIGPELPEGPAAG